jgi:hypothetical protein
MKGVCEWAHAGRGSRSARCAAGDRCGYKAACVPGSQPQPGFIIAGSTAHRPETRRNRAHFAARAAKEFPILCPTSPEACLKRHSQLAVSEICRNARKGRSICHNTACARASQRQAQRIVHETHRFTAPTSVRTARFSRHGREGISSDRRRHHRSHRIAGEVRRTRRCIGSSPHAWSSARSSSDCARRRLRLSPSRPPDRPREKKLL